MADEKVETKEEEKIEVEKAPVSAPVPVIDTSAIDSMKSDFENFKNETSARLNDSTGKLNKIKEIFTGEDRTAINEKIFAEITEDPRAAIEKYSQGKTAKEIEELKDIVHKSQLEKNDAGVLTRIKSIDSDYDAVFAGMGKYLTNDEYKKYENDPNRAEIFYSLAKTRMKADIEGKKVERTKANTIVKEIVNKTANSEIPAGGSNSDEGIDDLDKRISTRREQGDWSKGEEFTEKDADIFARYNRDTYGVKPKQ